MSQIGFDFICGSSNVIFHVKSLAVPWVVLTSKKISEVEMNLHDFLSSTKKEQADFPHFFVGQSS